MPLFIASILLLGFLWLGWPAVMKFSFRHSRRWLYSNQHEWWRWPLKSIWNHGNLFFFIVLFGTVILLWWVQIWFPIDDKKLVSIRDFVPAALATGIVLFGAFQMPRIVMRPEMLAVLLPVNDDGSYSEIETTAVEGTANEVLRLLVLLRNLGFTSWESTTVSLVFDPGFDPMLQDSNGWPNLETHDKSMRIARQNREIQF